jgi:redox-sensitive bicupin YhaK (pirin superfamily)
MTDSPSAAKIRVRKSADRGHAQHGWLDTRHTFSFADYFDREHMGFRSLRVINEDFVEPAAGFPTHPHRDMEIFSYVVAGAIAHRDSLGNGRTLRPGEIQLMSAGTGVTHSESNPSRAERLHLLQIWILPEKQGLKPSYTEWKPRPEHADASQVLLISPDGRDGSATIHQDAFVHRVRLAASETLEHEQIGRAHV